MKSGTLLMVLVVPVCFYLLINHRFSLLVGLLPLVVSGSLLMGVYEAGMVELFATEARYTGIGTCHNLAFCLFGGLTPMLLEWLCSNGWLLSVALWPALVSLGLLGLTYHWEDRFNSELIRLKTA